MNTGRWLLMVLAILLPNVMNAASASLEIEPFTIKPGETKEMLIDVNNADMEVTMVEFLMQLPSGLTVAKEKNKLAIAIVGRTTNHIVTPEESNGVIHVLLYSGNNEVLSGTSGPVLGVRLVASSSFSGGKITLEEQKLGSPDGTKSKPLTYTYEVKTGNEDAVTIQARSYTRQYGDANPEFGYDVTSGTITSGTPTITCSATATSPVGTYDIVISKGSVTNGTVNLVNGTLTITKAPLTISAGDYTKQEGEANPTFTPTFSGFKNGETKNVLTKQPTVSCSATTSSPAGTYPVTVSGAEAQNYNISYVNGTLTVTAKPDDVTLTAKSYTREYGEANPAFGYDVTSGTIKSGTPTITCAATKTSPVGTYDIIIAKGSVTNGTVNLVNGKLTITQAPLTIRAGDYTKQEGEANPTFTPTFSGFKNGETKSVLTKQPTISCSATTSSPAGTYPVTVSGAESQNYSISYINGTLTVTVSDDVTIQARSYTREYGEDNPTFGYDVTSGTITSGTPAITCEATKTSPVGTYDIIISKGSVSNSTVNLVKGTLTITRAPLTISAGNYTKQEGEANPTFTPTFSGFKNGETKSMLTKQPTVSCSATTSSPAGTYPVTVSGAEAQNYSISYINGTLTVTAKSVVNDNITFADAEVKRICVENWDTSKDGELSKQEAAAVTDLGEVFRSNKNIKSFNELQYFTGLTSIGNNAFYYCSGLTSVTIPNSVTSIGKSAFWGCSGLTAVTIPNSVTSIGYSTFYGCSGLTSVTIPNSVTSIGNSAFQNCSGLTSVTIPNSVTRIGDYAFDGCSGLTAVTIPNSATSIGAWAFDACCSLTSISIPNSVTSIGSGAFSNCYGLTSIKVDVSNNTYDSRDNCNAIIKTETNELVAGCKNTIIPNSVTSIGGNAFLGCGNLTSVTIPNSVTSIGYASFCFCRSLTSVTIPNNVTNIGSSAFSSCYALTVVNSYIEKPQDVTIGNYVFDDLPSDATLYVPKGTKEQYKAIAGWNVIKNIVEMIPADITLPECAKVLTGCLYAYFQGNKDYDTPYIWVWNDNGTNFCTSQDWPGDKLIKVGYDADQHAIWLWNGGAIKEGAALPTKILFSNNGIPRTDDFQFVNGGYYNAIGFLASVTTTKGDVNGDGTVDVADISSIIRVMADGSEIADSLADVNADGTVDVADISAVINIMAANARRLKD